MLTTTNEWNHSIINGETMKSKKSYLRYAIVVTFLLGTIAFGLKNYSDILRKEAFKELQNYNRPVALQKIRLAQVIWPPLRFDKPYQQLLANFEQIENRSALVIFLKEDYSVPKEALEKKDLDNFISEVKKMQGVKDVRYVSKEEALRIYKENNKDEPSLLELITPDILPQSIEVYLDDFSILNKVEELAKSKPFVYQVTKSF